MKESVVAELRMVRKEMAKEVDVMKDGLKKEYTQAIKDLFKEMTMIKDLIGPKAEYKSLNEFL